MPALSVLLFLFVLDIAYFFRHVKLCCHRFVSCAVSAAKRQKLSKESCDMNTQSHTSDDDDGDNSLSQTLVESSGLLDIDNVSL